MTFRRFVVRRAAFAVLSAYAVVTVMFFLTNLMTWDALQERLAVARYEGASQEEIEQLRTTILASRNLDVPIHERYVNWLVDVTTFEWGYSFAFDESVITVLDGRVQTTLTYVLPGVVLAVGLGVAFGIVVAFAKDGVIDISTRLGAYLLLGVPAFMFVNYYLFLSGTGFGTIGGIRIVAPALPATGLAAVTVATGLFAAQLRFARTAALEQTGRTFVKMLRAKGATRLMLGRHVLRNAAIPILSLSLSELLAVLVLEIYVIEDVLPISGLAGASLTAARSGDIPLVIWTTMVLVFIGIAGSFLQDVLAGYLDPRIHVG